MVKQIKDYIDDVQKKFPYLCKDDIETILDFGVRRYLQANQMNADVSFLNLVDDNMKIHCGNLGWDVLRHFYRWVAKWRMKERVLWKFKKKEWDGYYYIGLNDAAHKKIVNRKVKTFHNVYLVKIKDELKHEKWTKHIWRVPWIIDCGWKFFREKLSVDNAEYVGEINYEDYHQCFLGRFNNGYTSANNEECTTD